MSRRSPPQPAPARPPSRHMPAARASIPSYMLPTSSSRSQSLVQRNVISVAAKGTPTPPATAVRAQRRAAWAQDKKKPARHSSRGQQYSSEAARLWDPYLGYPEIPSPHRLPPDVAKAELGPGSLLQEEMLLAPFLGNRDLLRLSRAASWLVPYRNQLGEVKILKWCDDVTPAMLSGQRRLHAIDLNAFHSVSSLVRCLRGEHGGRPGVALRRLGLWWGCARQKAASASSGEDQEEDLWDLWDSLDEGVCPALEDLEIRRLTTLGTTAAFHLRQGLEGCPGLRRLKLVFYEDEAATAALAKALEWGLFPHLESLDIEARGFKSSGAGGWIGVALDSFPRPALRELRLHGPELCDNTLNALRGGACPGLRRLDMFFRGMEETHAGTLVEAVSECPQLRDLRLVVRGTDVYRGLAEHMREGGLPCLEELHVTGGLCGNGEILALAEVLEAREGSKLRLCMEVLDNSLDKRVLARLRAACGALICFERSSSFYLKGSMLYGCLSCFICYRGLDLARRTKCRRPLAAYLP
jgi:hypothetical protein